MKIHSKIQMFILQYNVDVMAAGYNLICLGRTDDYVDFALTIPYKNPTEPIKHVKVKSVHSISNKDLANDRWTEILSWLTGAGCKAAV